MALQIKSIRTFIGSQHYETSRRFYTDLGFEEIKTSEKMSYFKRGDFGFYLQDYYVKDWVDNSMLFLEVTDLESYYQEIKGLKLSEHYEAVRVSEIVHEDWGSEFFLHDPSGVLWHIGAFK